MIYNFSLAVERAELLFGNLDTNSDGDISEEEFVKNCFMDKDLCETLATTQGIGSQLEESRKSCWYLPDKSVPQAYIQSNLLLRKYFWDLLLHYHLFCVRQTKTRLILMTCPH